MEDKEGCSSTAIVGKAVEFLCDLTQLMKSPSVLVSLSTEQKYLHFSLSSIKSKSTQNTEAIILWEVVVG